MDDMTHELAIRLGGWDPRYAVVRGVACVDGVAAVLVDTNGDGGSVDLDQYHQGPDGEWIGDSSGGGAGEWGRSWSPLMVSAYGRAAPRADVVIDYFAETYLVVANGEGWWLFTTRSRDDHTMPRSRPPA